MIPNKSNFKFQELTPITGVKPYVIRFWETEFSEIAPISSDSGQKIYSRKDVEAIFKIKKLLFDDKLSIPEAKLKIKQDEGEQIEASSENEEVQVEVANIRQDQLAEAKNQLLHSLDFIRDIKFKRKW